MGIRQYLDDVVMMARLEGYDVHIVDDFIVMKKGRFKPGIFDYEIGVFKSTSEEYTIYMPNEEILKQYIHSSTIEEMRVKLINLL